MLRQQADQELFRRLIEMQRSFEKLRDARDHLGQFQKFKAQRPLDPRETAEMEKKIEEKEVALNEAERTSTQRMKSLEDAADAFVRELMKAAQGSQTQPGTNGSAAANEAAGPSRSNTAENALAIPALNASVPPTTRTNPTPAPTAEAPLPPAKTTTNTAPPIVKSNANPAGAPVAPPAAVARSDIPTSRIKAKAAVADRFERMDVDMENMQSLVYTLEDNAADREAALREQIADLERRAHLERRARQKDRFNHAEQRKLDLAKFEEVRAQDLAAQAAKNERMEAMIRETHERFAQLSALGAQQLDAVNGLPQCSEG